MEKHIRQIDEKEIHMAKLDLKPDEILVLRDVNSDMSSRDNFIWPVSGPVEAPDWEDTDICGHGLHGLPWGCGGDYRIGGDDAKWLVVRVSTNAGGYQHGTNQLKDKCKFHRGTVILCGSQKDAVDLISQYAPLNSPINWYSHITQQNRSTQTAGYGSTQIAGDRSTQTAGDESTQKAGNKSTQKAGYGSTQTAGGRSTQTAGYGSTQTAGGRSTQTAGDKSTQKAGYGSTQKAGYGSTQTAGVKTVQIQYWFDWEGNFCTACRIVGIEEAGKTYRCNKGEWILEKK